MAQINVAAPLVREVTYLGNSPDCQLAGAATLFKEAIPCQKSR